MAVQEFESIRIEVKNYEDASWTDITSKVVANPPPTATNIGVSDNGYLSRVGSGGEFTYEINNADGTNAALPLKDQCRVFFKWDNVEVCKFHGYRVIDSLKITPGIYGRKTIGTTYRGWLSWAIEWNLDYLEYATSKRIDEAVPLVVAGLPIQPKYTHYMTGDYTFPDVFDIARSNTTAGGEFTRLATSEIGYIYTRYGYDEGEMLVVENKLKRNDDTGSTAVPVYSGDHSGDARLLEDGVSYKLLEDGTSHQLLEENATISFGDADVLPGLQVSSNRLQVNYSTVRTRPRRVDADNTTILWTMESPTLVEAGGSVSNIQGRYRDPSGGANYVNGIEMQIPVRNTDFQAFANSDGTGTDYTADCTVIVNFKKSTAYAEISIYNTGSNDFYVGGPDITFQIRGKGVYVYDSTDVFFENTATNSFYPYGGRRAITWDMPYQSDATEMITLFSASWLKNSSGSTCEAYPLFANRDTKNMRAFMFMDVGSRATFAETETGYNKSAYINGYSWKIIDGKYVYWTPVLFDESRAPNF